MTRAAPATRSSAYGALVLTAALWGSSAVTARGLLDTMSPVALTAWRWVVVLAALAPFVWRERTAIAGAFAGDFRALATFALVGFAPQTLLVYVALEGTTAINLALFNSAIPVLIVAIAALLHRRRPRALELAGLAISLAGVVAIVARGQWSTLASLSFNPHDLLVLAGMAVWAYYTVRLADRAPALSFHAFMFAAGALGLAMIAPLVLWEALARGIPMPSPATLAGTVYLAVLPTLVAMLLFARGIARVVEGSGNGKLRVSFFRPFYGDYWILALDPGYRWVLVGEPGRSYAWILAREPKLDEATLEALLTRAAALGFDRQAFLRTPHTSTGN